MNIVNYTSGVPVARTVARIEEVLAAAGARAIGKNYDNGKLVSFTFQLTMNGRDHLIRLPSKPDAVYEALRADIKRPRRGTLEKLREQAERTAWKIQQDWLEIELTKLRLNQTEALQAFLSYIWDGELTFYDRLKGSGFKQLPERTA